MRSPPRAALPRLTSATCWTKAVCYEVADAVEKDFGKCDILVNGAGGNNPRATTDKEYFEEGDIDADTKSFFDRTLPAWSSCSTSTPGYADPDAGVRAPDGGPRGPQHHQHQQHERLHSAHEDPGVPGAKAAISNFTQWLAVHFSKVGIRCNAIAPGFFLHQAERRSAVERGTARPRRAPARSLPPPPMGRFGESEELDGALLFAFEQQGSLLFITGVVIPIDGGFSAYSGVRVRFSFIFAAPVQFISALVQLLTPL